MYVYIYIYIERERERNVTIMSSSGILCTYSSSSSSDSSTLGAVFDLLARERAVVVAASHSYSQALTVVKIMITMMIILPIITMTAPKLALNPKNNNFRCFFQRLYPLRDCR